MTRTGFRRTRVSGRKAGGFTLIEVMIAILVLGFGMLGFALLQTMSVRFVQSANYRTQATNLAYEMLDQIRANRVMMAGYAGNYTGSTSGCSPAGGAIADYKTAWSCRLGKALGDRATALVTVNGNTVKVDVTWGDDRWVEGADARTFSAETRL